jgi:hypothetical protein
MKIAATSQVTAIARGARECLKGLTRTEKRDAGKKKRGKKVTNNSDRERRVALHEAAHVVFAARVGATEVVFHGAQARNNRNYRALVQCNIPPDVPFTDYTFFLAAGVVAETVLSCDGLSGDGGASDYEAFLEGFLVLVNRGVFQVEHADVFWNEARRKVGTVFSYPDIRSPMAALADRVDRKLKEARNAASRTSQANMSELTEIPILLQLLNRDPKAL